jgi:hypothetical protein
VLEMHKKTQPKLGLMTVQNFESELMIHAGTPELH